MSIFFVSLKVSLVVCSLVIYVYIVWIFKFIFPWVCSASGHWTTILNSNRVRWILSESFATAPSTAPKLWESSWSVQINAQLSDSTRTLFDPPPRLSSDLSPDFCYPPEVMPKLSSACPWCRLWSPHKNKLCKYIRCSPGRRVTPQKYYFGARWASIWTTTSTQVDVAHFSYLWVNNILALKGLNVTVWAIVSAWRGYPITRVHYQSV